MSEETTFDRKVRERREARERADREAAELAAKKAIEDAKWAQFAPEPAYERTESDEKIDTIIAGITVIDAYVRWANKGTVAARPGQTESIKVRCPNPAHPDNHPSAWLNTEKNVGYCATCGGFDPLHMAAWNFGFDMNTYKEGPNFHRLRERVALDYGYTVSRVGKETVVYREDQSQPVPSGSLTPEPHSDKSDTAGQNGHTTEAPAFSFEKDTGDGTETLAHVVPIQSLAEAADDPFEGLPKLPWHEIVPKDSFLDVYMRQTTINESPEEYHFFSALMAIGFALGRGVTLSQVGDPVYGNLFICLLGSTGTGKSLSQRPLNELLRKALSYSNDPGSRGCKVIRAPGSPEALIREFQKPLFDLLTNKPVPGKFETIHGLVDFNELSALIKTADRKGSAMKSVLMAFYDGDREVKTVSLSTGEKIAFEPFCSLMTTTQPKAIRENLRQVDNASGFLNRFLFIPGVVKKRTYTAVPRVDIDPAITPLQLIAGWAASMIGTEEITWHEDALALWAAHFDERIWPYKHKEDYAILQRLELAELKLILLLSANKQEKVVTTNTVKEALLCHEFLVAAYQTLADALSETLEEQIVTVIMYQLERQDGENKGIGVGKLWNSIKGKKFPRDKFERVLTVLERIGQIERFQVNGQRGRPTEKVRRIA